MESGTTTYIVLKELAGNSPPRLNPIQQLLAPHIDTIQSFWVMLWFATASVLLVIVWREYRNTKKKGAHGTHTLD